MERGEESKCGSGVRYHAADVMNLMRTNHSVDPRQHTGASFDTDLITHCVPYIELQ